MQRSGAAVGLALALWIAVGLAAAHAQSDSAVPERRVKAAFLYKFASYVEWPPGAFPRPDAPITIGVIGDGALADELAELVIGRTVDDRPLAMRQLKDDDLPPDVHILFIAKSEIVRLRTLAPYPKPLLIVTESGGALNQGSAINFLVSGGRLRFEVALDNAEKRGLKLSSRLLTVAQRVRGAS